MHEFTGAPVDETSDEGVTALMAAAEEGHIMCLRLLIDAGLSSINTHREVSKIQSITNADSD